MSPVQLLLVACTLLSDISKGKVPPPPACEPDDILRGLCRLTGVAVVEVTSPEQLAAITEAVKEGRNPEEALAAVIAAEAIGRAKH